MLGDVSGGFRSFVFAMDGSCEHTGFFNLQGGQISFQRSQTEEDSGINIMSQVLLWAVQRTSKQRF